MNFRKVPQKNFQKGFNGLVLELFLGIKSLKKKDFKKGVL